MPPTVKLTSQAFGRENTGVVYGWIGASHQLGASMAAFGAGAIRTVVGGYELAFWMAGVLCVLAGMAFLTVGRRSFAPARTAESLAAASGVSGARRSFRLTASASYGESAGALGEGGRRKPRFAEFCSGSSGSSCVAPASAQRAGVVRLQPEGCGCRRIDPHVIHKR